MRSIASSLFRLSSGVKKLAFVSAKPFGASARFASTSASKEQFRIVVSGNGMYLLS